MCGAGCHAVFTHLCSSYVAFFMLSDIHPAERCAHIFFSSRFPDPKDDKDLGTETDINTDQQLCYHVLGTPQSSDVVVFAMPDHPTWMTGAEVTDDGR